MKERESPFIRVDQEAEGELESPQWNGSSIGAGAEQLTCRSAHLGSERE